MGGNESRKNGSLSAGCQCCVDGLLCITASKAGGDDLKDVELPEALEKRFSPRCCPTFLAFVHWFCTGFKKKLVGETAC